jgi:hypothetical protein
MRRSKEGINNKQINLSFDLCFDFYVVFVFHVITLNQYFTTGGPRSFAGPQDIVGGPQNFSHFGTNSYS